MFGWDPIRFIKFISASRSSLYEIGAQSVKDDMSRVMRKPTFLFPTRFDTNQAVQPQKMARGLEISDLERRGVVLSMYRKQGRFHLSCNTLYLLSPRICFFIILKRGLIVNRDDSLTN